MWGRCNKNRNKCYICPQQEVPNGSCYGRKCKSGEV